MRATSFVLLVAACTVAACSTATRRGAAGATRTDSQPRNVLTQEQLVATSTANLYDAIHKLRPEWLSSRGPTSVTDATPTMASVYMNGTLLGTADYLRQVNVQDVTSVRYWDAGQASARFGMGHPRGVIELLRESR